MSKCIGAIDQDASSTRSMLSDRRGPVVSMAQMEHRQVYPKPGWVEHDPLEILERCRARRCRTRRRGMQPAQPMRPSANDHVIEPRRPSNREAVRAQPPLFPRA